MLFQPAVAGTDSITQALAGAAALVPAVAAALADQRTNRVPNALVALAIVPTLVAVRLADHPAHLLTSLALGVGAMALPLLVVHLVAPAAMGFGDVKLAVALGAGLGVLEPTLAVLALAIASGLTLLVAACSRRSAMPFAPGLVLGATAAMALGAFKGWSVPT